MGIVGVTVATVDGGLAGRLSAGSAIRTEATGDEVFAGVDIAGEVTTGAGVVTAGACATAALSAVRLGVVTGGVNTETTGTAGISA